MVEDDGGVGIRSSSFQHSVEEHRLGHKYSSVGIKSFGTEPIPLSELTHSYDRTTHPTP